MRKKINTLLCVMALAVFAFSSVGITFAAWKISNTSDHVINTASVSGKIVEKYDGGENIYPGNTVEKVVNVCNTGKADSIVRVKVEKMWGDKRDNDGNLTPDSTFSTDNILIEYNNEYWMYDTDDGYYYYKGFLKPGETTLKPLFEEYTIDSKTGVEYSGKTADITVKMECVQAAYDGISIWNKTYTNLGVTYTEPEKPAMTTKVQFNNPTAGFTFTPTDKSTYSVSVQDLFYNFKNLLPGETRGQTITLTNSYYSETEVFLRAEYIEQSLSSEQVDKVNKLLREYVTVKVTDDTGRVIYNGPIWGHLSETGINPDTMTNDISLGKLASGTTESLNVQLQVSTEMGNEYADIWGLIRWVWSAEGAETPVNPPQTGDSTNLALFIALAVGSAIAFILLLQNGRRKKEEAQLA